ncbi:MAG: SDR family NAD(P)-dependent oxidoreductase [Hyphomonadaceae bacterium]|nr:SDR family NAD(P)-dependent oxidoreductase [Hyphomonadaceae bacterium]
MADAAKTWLITGCTSGFGRALAERALARGDRVAVTALDETTVADFSARYPERALILKLDVTKPDEVRAGLDRAFAAFGRLDVLVNNAGFAIQTSIEDADDALVRRMFEVNTFGAIDVTRAALPRMRAQGAGHIVNFSSVGGRTSGPLVSLYCASKFAVEGFSLGLAAEVAPFGLKVTVIEPGAYATNFGASVIRPAPSEAYRPAAEAMKAMLGTLKEHDPAWAARVIAEVVDAPNPPLQMIIGEDAYVIIEDFNARQRREMEEWRALSCAASRP